MRPEGLGRARSRPPDETGRGTARPSRSIDKAGEYDPDDETLVDGGARAGGGLRAALGGLAGTVLAWAWIGALRLFGTPRQTRRSGLPRPEAGRRTGVASAQQMKRV